MPWWLAVPLTVLLLIVSGLLDSVVGFSSMPVIVLATAAWCAFDSRKIGLERYKSGIAYRPWLLFFAVALLWIFGFPWYLIVRHRILSGRAKLKGSGVQEGVGPRPSEGDPPEATSGTAG